MNVVKLSILLSNQVHVDTTYENIIPRVILKKFIPLTEDTLHVSCKTCLHDVENDIYENDGLIFTPNDKVGGNELYENKNAHELRSDYDFVKSGKDFKRLLKWKDTQFNSIDFKIKFIGTHERPLKMGDDYVMNTFMICLLLVTYDQKQEPFTRNQFIEFMKNPEPIHNKKTFVETFKPCNPEDEYAHRVILPIVDGQVRCKVNDSWTGTKISENDIVEMIYDKDADVEYRWTPIRVRKDKDFPNFYKVASDIWQSYYRPVTLSIMIGDESIPSIEDEVDVYYNDSASSDSKLRQFHRLCVKNALFEETLGKSEGKRLLDLGSGRGGDISRYFDYDAEVVGVDGSVDNLHNQYSGAYVRLSKLCKWC